MKNTRKLAVLVAVLAIVCGLTVIFAPHRTKAQTALSNLSRVGGVYMSQAYSGWGAYILSGNSATGAQTITVCPAFTALPDGRKIGRASCRERVLVTV